MQKGHTASAKLSQHLEHPQELAVLQFKDLESQTFSQVLGEVGHWGCIPSPRPLRKSENS